MAPAGEASGPPLRCVAVATSGGRDSIALLHCALRQARPQGITVIALHVHHGLLPQADAWLRQVRTQCRRWGAGFFARHLTGAPAAGQSVEAWARAGRYAALAEMAREAGCRLVLLAHHRRDQAETWLLQALRGAAAAGLSAMPTSALRDGVTWVRPWLDHAPEAIQAYVERHRIAWVDDPSNADRRFARSRLREQVWPVLSQAFPDAERCLYAAATHAPEDAQLRAEVAAMDLPTVVDGSRLAVTRWVQLPPARRALALRAWLRSAPAAAAVPESLVQRLLRELPGSAQGRWPAARGELRLYRGLLDWRASGARQTAAVPEPLLLDLSRPGCHKVAGWDGCFRVAEVRHGGVPASQLCRVVVRARRAGERFRRAPGAASRGLKKQFQALGLPVWERRCPLVCTPDGQLIFVPGLGVEASFQAGAGVTQMALTWHAASPG